MVSRQGQISVLFLKAGDLFLLVAALGASIAVYHAPGLFTPGFLSTRVRIGNALLVALLLAAWHLCFKVNGLYRSYRLSDRRELLRQILKAVAACAAVLLAAAQFNPWRTINIWTLAGFFVLALLFVGGFRLVVFHASRRFRRRGINTKSLLVLGGGDRSRRFIASIEESRELGYRVLGYLDSDPEFSRGEIGGRPCLGGFGDLGDVLDAEVVDEVVIALPVKSQYSRIGTAVTELEKQGVTVHILSDFFPRRLARLQPQEFRGFPLLSLHSAPVFHWRTEVKRLFDIGVSLTLLALLTPLFVVVAALIKFDSRGPVFFTQERVGYNRRRFRMIKFRTMVADAEERLREVEHLNEKDGAIFKIRNDPRVTRVGRFLRRSSVDELPQLFNVLLGDMSLVGPRPLSVRDALRLDSAWQKRRFSIRPGMTCLWQISGRSELSFEEWMELDLKYIDTWSLQLDGWILLMTIPAVLTARGAV